MTLPEFLMARIVEEESCPACGHGRWAHYGRWCRAPRGGAVNAKGNDLICCCEAVDRDESRKLLDDCAVKRWIIEAHQEEFIHPERGSSDRAMVRYIHKGRLQALWSVMLAMATVYSDHPDFQEEWKI